MTKEQLLYNVHYQGGRMEKVEATSTKGLLTGFLPKINKRFKIHCQGFSEEGVYDDAYAKFSKLVATQVPPSRLGPKRKCPKCGRDMTIRCNKQGKRFWGCSKTNLKQL